MNVNTICNALLDALAEVGYHEHTIFNYKGVIRRFKSFCEEKDITEYTPDFGQTYADDVISKKNRYV